MRYIDLAGIWTAKADGFCEKQINLPGTLEAGGIGYADEVKRQWHPDVAIGNAKELVGENKILTRLTRRYVYEGSAFFTKTISWLGHEGRVFLEAERSRRLRLNVNGYDVEPVVPGTLSTPYVFEITNFLQAGKNTITLCCDNSYSGWPAEAILASCAASDETQTNWNGIIGYLRLRLEKENFISALRAYSKARTVDVEVEFDCATDFSGRLSVSSPALSRGHVVTKWITLQKGKSSVWFRGLRIFFEDITRWDEYSSTMYEVKAFSPKIDEAHANFGLRHFIAKNGKISLNSKNIFLRCETNCCVFPQTGHMPMNKSEWIKILQTYKSYGINCVRFHSHCPPRAAFEAADEMGMFLQPELSNWDVSDAFESETSWKYYQNELEQILLCYANHPSFIMFALGNELSSDVLGYKRMILLVQYAKKMDPTRLHAVGSNNFIGRLGADATSDFYTASCFYDTPLRGTSQMMQGYINEEYPGARRNFNTELALIRTEFEGPVFGFEVGQYSVLPDFEEWNNHEGITLPDNYMHIRKRAEKAGLMDNWKRRAAASGELALICYREEAEAALRTVGFSGLSLLGLQDFPGQGTALVGMLDAFMQAKPHDFAIAERFRQSFNYIVLLAILEKYTYTFGEEILIKVKTANYSRDDVCGETCFLRIFDGENIIYQKEFFTKRLAQGGLTNIGEILFKLEQTGDSIAKRLDLRLDGFGAANSYPLWVYLAEEVVVPDDIVVANTAKEAYDALKLGRRVFYDPMPDAENFPGSAKAHFSTDFWTVGTFPEQSGFMGLLIDPQHPAFADFPTDFHSNWQWWAMCQGRAMKLPADIKPVITGLDSYARLRNLGLLTEFCVGKGRLMISSMGLHRQQQYPEVRALILSILKYMASDAFAPLRHISFEDLQHFAPISP